MKLFGTLLLGLIFVNLSNGAKILFTAFFDSGSHTTSMVPLIKWYDFKGSVHSGKKLAFVLIFGKFMKSSFFVFIVNSESLTASR